MDMNIINNLKLDDANQPAHSPFFIVVAILSREYLRTFCFGFNSFLETFLIELYLYTRETCNKQDEVEKISLSIEFNKFYLIYTDVLPKKRLV